MSERTEARTTISRPAGQTGRGRSPSANAARRPPRSSASSPRDGRAPWRGDLTSHGERVERTRAEQLGRAGHRLGGKPAGEVGAEPMADARVGLRLSHERHVGRSDARQRGRDGRELVGHVHHPAEPAEQCQHRRLELGIVLGPPRRRCRRVDDHAAPDLDRRVRHQPEQRRAGVRVLQRRRRGAADDRCDRLGMRGDLQRDLLELIGLVAQHDQLGRLRHLDVGGGPPAELVGQRLRAARAGIGHEHGVAPARAIARAMFPAPIRPTFIAQTQSTGARTWARHGGHDWLKKPFSTSRARSSEETSTLRGVSRKTLSAIRSMPPSSA